MTTIVFLPPRIPQLVRLLASDSDGEVVAAARALRRTLASVSMDMNDLAARLEGHDVPDQAKMPSSWASMSSQKRAAFLEMALRGDVLSSWERDFAESVRGQIQTGRRLSEKQDAICARIYAKWMD